MTKGKAAAVALTAAATLPAASMVTMAVFYRRTVRRVIGFPTAT